MPIIYAVVASGGTVSGDVDLRKAKLQAIYAPVVDSGDLALRASFSTTSAEFVRLTDPLLQGSGDLRYPTAAGSRMVLYTLPVTPPYVRLEVITPANSFQTDNRTFTLLTRPR